jgi:hypothetical protein
MVSSDSTALSQQVSNTDTNVGKGGDFSHQAFIVIVFTYLMNAFADIRTSGVNASVGFIDPPESILQATHQIFIYC